MNRKPKQQTAEEWEDLFVWYLDSIHDELLDSFEDTIFDRAVQCVELANASSRDVHRAVKAALARFKQYLKPVPQTAADRKAGIWRDSQGRAWKIPAKSEK